ncbi:hypothetical protein RJ640_010867 [Escallonia rubra]|uniref:Retrotransposon gag domain-containing protein n=1 Tax=Escallonia rubra TaxID=112253 RepID=A0AA88RV37_9ASTE|nr:hypothetical protein RJ640_010867 [Escallonia rubra]
MQATLILQGLLKVLKGNQGLLETMSADEKDNMLERARSALLLCLADNFVAKYFSRKDCSWIVAEIRELVHDEVFEKSPKIEASIVYSSDERINVKDDMVEEFLRLEQGEDETVKDYEARFARLLRFATHVIDTEERRATRFKNGLRYWIRKFLTAVTIDTYGQVLDKAQRVEKDVEAGRKYYKEQR